MKKIIFTIFALLLLSAGCGKIQTANNNQSAESGTDSVVKAPAKTPSNAEVQEPISGGLSRITKKSFGLKVSPKNSPVSPEKFSGYHTGIDFETAAAEKNIDLKITAACTGTVALKKYASGYGGVLVQYCKIDNQDVTVIYGHLRLTSITQEIGQNLNIRDPIGVLGTGYSSETDGERKHLHFGVHLGANVNIKGYVQRQAELNGWLDPQKYLK